MGAGLAIVGAGAAILSIFLPLVQRPTFMVEVRSNSLVQNQGYGQGIWLRMVLLAVIALALTWRYYSTAGVAGPGA